MALRYLNIANSHWAPGKTHQDAVGAIVGRDRFESVLQQLLELSAGSPQNFDVQQENAAYVIIVDQLLEYTPPAQRRTITWRLAKNLPRSFLPVIEDIVRNCP